MDDARFDALTRVLAAPGSRRRVLGVLGAGIAAVGLRRRSAEAQICPNLVCRTEPEVCPPDCPCCVFPNGNNRCLSVTRCARAGGVSFSTCETCGEDPCGFGTFCGHNPGTQVDCVCAVTTDETCACFQPICGVGEACTTSADCPEGFACVVEQCCGVAFCAALCQTELGGVGAAETAVPWGR